MSDVNHPSEVQFYLVLSFPPSSKWKRTSFSSPSVGATVTFVNITQIFQHIIIKLISEMEVSLASIRQSQHAAIKIHKKWKAQKGKKKGKQMYTF